MQKLKKHSLPEDDINVIMRDLGTIAQYHTDGGLWEERNCVTVSHIDT